MKKLALVLAAFSMATMFTACGDDSSSSDGDLLSCDMKSSIEFLGEKFETHSCAEITNTSENKTVLDENCVSIEGMVTMSKGTGCASGEKKKCTDPEDGSVMYFYDEDAAEKSCDDLMKDDDDDDDDLDFGDDEEDGDDE